MKKRVNWFAAAKKKAKMAGLFWAASKNDRLLDRLKSFHFLSALPAALFSSLAPTLSATFTH